ncbi:hypothetical protein F0562_027669 [Nyssa sinensis]|uniref:Uncharacterized protein n=1 Tax=Nyssa sinensis TaxID=561372 RepID=A0A5J5B973_9ASTE|nr:hypothetical protein F0562_027669 [Nyssa sinensis]
MSPLTSPMLTPEETVTVDTLTSESILTEWTDEKHRKSIHQMLNPQGKCMPTPVSLLASLRFFKFHVRDSHLCCHDLAGSNTEVSDQNFVDEDIKGDKTNHICSAKRVKTSVAASSSNDQVVPFEKSPTDR